MKEWVRAVLVQLGALAVLSAVAYGLPMMVPPPYPLWGWVLAQGGLAALLSYVIRQERWWLWIQLGLPLLLYGALQTEIDFWWAFLIVVIVWLVFFNSGRERVPLYLSNRTTQQALSEMVQDRDSACFMDLGSGLGGTVAFMAQHPRVTRSRGVETAPLPYLWSRLWTAFKGGEVVAQSLWKAELSQCDLVYAFLSSEPMARLWEKVRVEMKPGSVFVSNTFAVPGVEPSEVWELADERKTRLYLYRL